MKKMKSIQELEKAVVDAEEAIAKNEEKLEQAKDRLPKAEARCADLSEQIEAAKEEFIRRVNNQEDLKPLRKKRNELAEEKETEEAIVTGAKINIDVCEGMKELLNKDLMNARKELLKETSLRPLVEWHNELGRQMAVVCERIERTTREYSTMRADPYERPVITESRYVGPLRDHKGLDFIPELSVDGESLPPLYDRRRIRDTLQQEHLQAHRVKRDQQMKDKREEAERLREELEDTYKDAPCMRCKHYLGVSLGSNFLSCDSFYGGIPVEILTGTINHAVQRIGWERFLFEEKEEEKQGK